MKTIGYLSGSINIGIGRALYSAIIETARQHDVNLVCYFGGISRDIDNTLIHRITRDSFKLVNARNLDGLIIWTSSLRYCMEYSAIEDFIRNSLSMPIISLAHSMPGIPSIMIDNRQGISEVMRHMIEVHGKRKIAFIRADDEHPYSHERLQAYRDLLQAYGIPINEDLITPPGNFSYTTGWQAARILFDERKLRPGIDIDAIIASSDNHIFGLMDEFEKRQIRVPHDIALTGFNNKLEARAIAPALTTLEPDFANHGTKAVELLLELIGGGKVEADIRLPTRMIVRQSCGCFKSPAGHSKSDREIDFRRLTGNAQASCRRIQEQKAALISHIAARFSGLDTGIPGWCENLVEQILLDLPEFKTNNFLYLFESYLVRTYKLHQDNAVWIDVLAEIANQLLPLAGDTHTYFYVKDTLYHARLLIENMNSFRSESAFIRSRTQNFNLIEIGQLFNSALTLEELKRLILDRLAEQGIKNYYVALFQEENRYAQWLLAVRNNRQVLPAAENQKVLADDIVIKDLFGGEEPLNIIYKPLYVKNNELGFVLFSVEFDDYFFYELLRQEISTALQFIIHLEEQYKAKAERLKLLLDLEMKNAELNRVLEALWGEMELAHKIQTSLLPREIAVPGYEIVTYMKPATNVGGDYFDIIRTEAGDSWLTIGDVSGHGVTSGLIAMMLQTSLLSIVISRPQISPLELLLLANKILYRNVAGRLGLVNFITVCFMRFDTQGNFRFAGAHQDILIYRCNQRKVEQLETDGLWLCMVNNPEPEPNNDKFMGMENGFVMDKGDTLLLYTDGLVEYANDAKEMYGLKRLIRFLEQHGEAAVPEISRLLVAELDRFRGKQKDDISFVVCRKV